MVTLRVVSKNESRSTGQWGEVVASTFLVGQGFVIEEMNWRFSRYEIDIIAWDAEVLVFIEVKTRSSTSFYAPEATLDKHKWQRLARAAGAYMEKVGHEWEIRFDTISVWKLSSGQT